MTNIVEAGRLDQIAPGTSRLATLADKSIALFNVDGTVYAIADTCLHTGSSLAAGKIDGKIVTCRGHGWKFDVTTGFVTSSPGLGVASFPVTVVDGKIMVDIGA